MSSINVENPTIFMDFFIVSDICHRITNLREKLNLKQIKFASELKIKRPTLAGYEKGDFPPSTEFLLKIRKIYNVNINWLLTGEGEMYLSGKEIAIEKPLKPGFKQIPIYSERDLPEGAFIVPLIDQKLSAGDGAFLPEEDQVTALVHVPSYLSRYGDKIKALTVDGDSMSPTLHRGDIVVCDSNGYSGEGVYAIQEDGTGIVKRITKEEGSFYIVSDNGKYARRKAPEEGDNFRIIGRIHCAITSVE